MAKGLEEVSYKMYNVSGVRNLDTINHTVGLKETMLRKDLVLLAIRLQVVMTVCLWCIM